MYETCNALSKHPKDITSEHQSYYIILLHYAEDSVSAIYYRAFRGEIKIWNYRRCYFSILEMETLETWRTSKIRFV